SPNVLACYCPDLLRRAVQSPYISGADNYTCALLGESTRNRRTDSCAGTGDECNPIPQAQIHIASPRSSISICPTCRAVVHAELAGRTLLAIAPSSSLPAQANALVTADQVCDAAHQASNSTRPRLITIWFQSGTIVPQLC